MVAILVDDPFSNEGFVERFVHRRHQHDSVNSCVDEPAIFRHIRTIKPATALELGCASGGLTTRIAKYCGHITAIDRSELMIKRAISSVHDKNINFICSDFSNFIPNQPYDIVLGSMFAHLIEDFDRLSHFVYKWLKPGGGFLFSQRHPIRTAYPIGEGKILNSPTWTVTNYFDLGERTHVWLDHDVKIFHRSISDIINTLISSGFSIKEVSEPQPESDIRTDRTIENSFIPSILMILSEK